MGRLLSVGVGLAVLGTLRVQAAPIINVGNFNLQANKANQTIQIQVSGGDAVQGLNLEVQTGNGGPTSGGTAGGAAPLISGINALTGTIFNSNNTGQHGSGPITTVPAATEAQVYEATTTTNSGTVSASGLLATITFDTTGFNTNNAVYSLLLKGTNNGDTNFAGLGATIVNGTITIQTPEPASLGLFALGIPLVMRRRRRSGPLAA